MKDTYQVYLISDSTGETLDRIFMALKAQFKDFKYKINAKLFYMPRTFKGYFSHRYLGK